MSVKSNSFFNRIASTFGSILMLVMFSFIWISLTPTPVQAACTIGASALTSPNGGENLNGTIAITWDGGICDSGEGVNLEYSDDWGWTYTSIATCTNVLASLGTCTWNTTTVADDTDYLVRIEQDGFPGNEDFSDAQFTIDNTAPSIAETDITVDASACTGTGGTCKIWDTVKITVNGNADTSISEVEFTSSAGGDVLFDLTTAVANAFSDDGAGADTTGSDNIWSANFVIEDSTSTTGSADNGTYGIEVTLTDAAGNTQTITSATSTLDVDNIVPTLAETVISILGSSDATIAGNAGIYNENDTVDVSVDVSGLWDAGATPVTFNGTSATDVGAITQTFNDAGTAPDAGAADDVWSSRITASAGSVDDSSYGFVIDIEDDAGNIQSLTATTNTIDVDNEAPAITETDISISSAGSGTGGAYIIWDDLDVEVISPSDTSSIVFTSAGAGDVLFDIDTAIDVAFNDAGTSPDTWSSDDTWTGRTVVEASGSTPSTTGVDNGSYGLEITITDDAGNTQTITSTTNTINIDNIAPTIGVAGTVALSNDVWGDTIASIGDELTYAGGTAGSADGDSWTLDMSSYGLTNSEAEGAITLIADDDDGAFSANETITDNAGNTASAAATITGGFNIDNEAPNLAETIISILGSSDATIAGNAGVYNENDTIDIAVNLTGLADANATPIAFNGTSATDVGAITQAFNDAGTAPDAGAADDIWSSRITTGAGSIDNSVYGFSVIITDDANNTQTLTATTNTIDVDNEAPAIAETDISILSTGSGTGSIHIIWDNLDIAVSNSPTDTSSIVFTSAGAGDVLFDLDTTVDTAFNDAGTAPDAGAADNVWSARAIIEDSASTPSTTGADNGTYGVEIIITDDAGNIQTITSVTNTLDVDNIAPNITVAGTLAVTTNNTGGANAAVGDGITYSGGTVGSGDGDVWIADFTNVTGDNPATDGAEYTVIAGAIDNANYSVTETVTDNAGNTDTGSTGTLDVDNVIPVFEDTTSDSSVYTVGDVLSLTADMTEDSTEIASMTVDLSTIDSNLSSTFALTDGDVDTIFDETSWPLQNATMSADGDYSLTFTATDDSGNVQTDNSLTITIFKDKPVVYGIVATPNPTDLSWNTLVSALIIDDIGVDWVRYTIVDDTDTDVVTNQVVALPEDGVWGDVQESVEIDITADISWEADGVYTIEIQAEDANGWGELSYTTFTISGDAVWPVISNLTEISVDDTSATITWTTNENSTTVINVFTEATCTTSFNGGASDLSNSDLVSTHIGTISSLTEDTTFYYTVTSVDGSSNSTSSACGTFDTLETDTVAPVVTDSWPEGFDTDGDITLTVTTDENATCKYDTADKSYANLTDTFTTTGWTSHSETINGLTDGNYNYYVRCTDGSNIMENSAVITFSVAISDVAWPTISELNDYATTTDQAVVLWSTNENATTEVNLFTEATCTTVYNAGASDVNNTDLATTHVAVLNSLDSGTTFYYTVTSVDSDTNSTTSACGSFATPASDTIAPIVTDSSPEGTDTDGDITLSVTTSENATCKYDTADKSYSNLANTFTITGTTAHSETINGLTDDSYQYYVRCEDGASNSMSSSAIVNFDVLISDVVWPVISELNDYATTTDQAVVVWSTNENSTTEVNLFTEATCTTVYNAGANDLNNTDLTTTHLAVLNSLDSGTTFYYTVTSTDSDTNSTTSACGTFGTPASDTIAPIVTDSWPEGTDTDGSVTLSITTSENATCKYSTTDQSYGNMPSVFTTTWGTSHSEALAGLSDGEYLIFVRCTDGSNEMGNSALINFDVASVLINSINVSIVETTTTTAEMVISVDNFAQYKLKVDDNSDFGSTIEEDVAFQGSALFDEKVFNRTVTGLTANTIYYVQIEAQDSESNTLESLIYAFKTNSLGAPIVTNFETSSISGDSATITWDTKEDDSGIEGGDTNSDNNVIQYGTTINLGTEVASDTGDGVATHSITLSGLDSNTKYYFRVGSEANGETTYSQIFSFTTSPESDRVNNLSATKTYATADDTYPNGFEWEFDFTIADETETDLALKFDQWVSGSNTLNTANNMRFSVDWGTTFTTITANSTYSTDVDVSGIDEDNEVWGRQITILVQMKVPVWTSAGSYSSSYGIRAQTP